MTEVAFHFGAADKLAYASRLLRKATGSGARVLVCVDAEQSQALQDSVWGLGATDFITVCDTQADAFVQQRSVIVLTDKAPQSPSEFGVLVNLQAEVPAGFAQYPRLIEIVSQDADDRAQARLRCTASSAGGYPIVRHDVGSKAGVQNP